MFAVRLLIRVYFCLFMFCFLYSLQLSFPRIFICALKLALALLAGALRRAHFAAHDAKRTVFTFILQLYSPSLTHTHTWTLLLSAGSRLCSVLLFCSALPAFAIFSFSQRKYGAHSGCKSEARLRIKKQKQKQNIQNKRHCF